VVTTSTVPGRVHRLVPLLGPAFAVMAVVMVPWTVYLAIDLPERAVSHHYDTAWVGFDVALMLVLAATGRFAQLRSRWFPLAASAAATMLVVDAWFDVVTAPAHQRMLSVLLAALVELPLASLCLYWAHRWQDVMIERLSMWRRQARRLQAVESRREAG
jgi:hypothetical protein